MIRIGEGYAKKLDEERKTLAVGDMLRPSSSQ